MKSMGKKFVHKKTAYKKVVDKKATDEKPKDKKPDFPTQEMVQAYDNLKKAIEDMQNFNSYLSSKKADHTNAYNIAVEYCKTAKKGIPSEFVAKLAIDYREGFVAIYDLFALFGNHPYYQKKKTTSYYERKSCGIVLDYLEDLQTAADDTIAKTRDEIKKILSCNTADKRLVIFIVSCLAPPNENDFSHRFIGVEEKFKKKIEKQANVHKHIGKTYISAFGTPGAQNFRKELVKLFEYSDSITKKFSTNVFSVFRSMSS